MADNGCGALQAVNLSFHVQGGVPMTDSEKRQEDLELEKMEREVPAFSAAVLGAAYRKAMDSGLSVYVARQEAIFEVFPDGRKPRFIKKVDAPTQVRVGTQVRIP
jgi:hypothetical protein